MPYNPAAAMYADVLLGEPTGGIEPVTAVVVDSTTLDYNVPTPLGDLITDPGNTIELQWQMNDVGGEVGSPLMWRNDAAGYAGTAITSAMSQPDPGGPYPFILRGFTAGGAYADFAIDVTVVSGPQ